MRCPVCGTRTVPYGGFGHAEEWRRVGKYRCERTVGCGVWYGDPLTGQVYRREGHGRIRLPPSPNMVNPAPEGARGSGTRTKDREAGPDENTNGVKDSRYEV